MLKQPSKVLRTATHVFLLLLLDVINVHDLRCWAVEGVATRLGAAPHTTDKGRPRAERNVTEQSRLARARAVIEVSTKTRRSAYATGSVGTNVDKIEDVELGPTHIVITTTKQGPVDSLKIHIELIDLHDNRTLPPIQLYGLFLVIARGRYTVPFLKPERWYGLTFSSENQVNGETNVHKETRLLRTTNRQHNITTAEDLYEVIMHRNVDGEESAERLYVTSEWIGEERLPHGELHTNVRVHCESSSTTEQMILHSDEDSVTIEISMDLLYNVEQMNETLHKVIAHITPLRCHEICWQSTLMADTGAATFAKDGARECHQIEGTNSTAFLRHMTRYTVEKQGSGYELVVETELQEDSEEGLVTLAALNLGKDNNKVRTKTFSSKSSNRTFRLPLAEDSVYAVQYQYTKVKPFHYTTKEHFLVETIPGNTTDVSQPLIEAQFAMENHTTITGGVTQTPTVTLGRGDAYSNHEVVVRVDPQCEDTNISSTWTFGDDERQTNEKMDLTAAICYNYPKASFCDPARNYTTVCSQMLCYSAAVAIEGADYPSNARCVNVTEHFPVDSVSSPIHVQISVLLLIFSLFFMLV